LNFNRTSSIAMGMKVILLCVLCVLGRTARAEVAETPKVGIAKPSFVDNFRPKSVSIENDAIEHKDAISRFQSVHLQIEATFQGQHSHIPTLG
jgi:hypothetical protein